MGSRIDWLFGRGESRAGVSNAGTGGALRIALLFSSVAIGLALILTPILERRTRSAAVFDVGTDRTVTGSVGERKGAYTVRRSVLQASPQAVCIIRADGSRRGAC